MIIDMIGATNQLAMIIMSLDQLMLLPPETASPEPIKAPTTVCVPEMGIPNKLDDIMKTNDEIDAPSIIFSTRDSSIVSTPSMTLPTSYPATCPLQK